MSGNMSALKKRQKFVPMDLNYEEEYGRDYAERVRLAFESNRDEKALELETLRREHEGQKARLSVEESGLALHKKQLEYRSRSDDTSQDERRREKALRDRSLSPGAKDSRQEKETYRLPKEDWNSSVPQNKPMSNPYGQGKAFASRLRFAPGDDRSAIVSGQGTRDFGSVSRPHSPPSHTGRTERSSVVDGGRLGKCRVCNTKEGHVDEEGRPKRCFRRCPCNWNWEDDHRKKICKTWCNRPGCRLFSHYAMDCPKQCTVCGQIAEVSTAEYHTGRECTQKTGIFRCLCERAGHFSWDCDFECYHPGCGRKRCEYHCVCCGQPGRAGIDGHPAPKEHGWTNIPGLFKCKTCKQAFWRGHACKCPNTRPEIPPEVEAEFGDEDAEMITPRLRKCWVCDEMTDQHVASTCPQRCYTEGIGCLRCGSPDHTVRKCPLRFAQNQRANDGNDIGNDAGNAGNDIDDVTGNDVEPWGWNSGGGEW